jgi:ribosomal protein S18 acetylase RimI-like enzyme
MTAVPAFAADPAPAAAPASARLIWRAARPADLAVIVRQRREMFAANGHAEAVVAPMSETFTAWLAPRLASGVYFGWIVEDEAGRAVAGLGMMELDWPPHPLHPGQDRRGYILNVFVDPGLRVAGVGRALMDRATAEGRRRGLDVLVLHASAMGRSLYESLGWRTGNEMLLPLA